jgi:hypothetical protein
MTGYGIFKEATLEGYVGEYFPVNLRTKPDFNGNKLLLKVTPKPPWKGITAGVFDALKDKYDLVGVIITDFGTLEATFVEKDKPWEKK